MGLRPWSLTWPGQCQQHIFTQDFIHSGIPLLLRTHRDGEMEHKGRTLSILKGSCSNEQRAGELSKAVLESIHLDLHIGIVGEGCLIQVLMHCIPLPQSQMPYTQREAIWITTHSGIVSFPLLSFFFFSLCEIIHLLSAYNI